MPTHARSIIAPLCILTVALAACTHTDAEHGATADTAATGRAPNMVNVTATEYAFEMPDTIPAGLTTFRLVDAGKELHHVQLIKLADGKTMSDFVKAVEAGGPPPTWATEAGGVNAPRPGGGEASTTLAVAPGNYAVVCLIPDAKGVPHVAKGMLRPLTVTAATGPAATEPTSDVTIKLADYSFELPAPISAGTHTIRVENDGAQPHEVQIVRLAPGKTAADVAAWVDHQQGPPPGEPIGGVPAIPVGTHAFVTANFTPGNYALLCFVPDTKDGKPHTAHGMVKQITVS